MLYAIEVEGTTLIDPSFVDTVLDTPMKNYATLDGGKNGNLTGDGSYLGLNLHRRARRYLLL